MKNKRWYCRESVDIESPKEIEDFLNEYDKLCKKHNMSLSHEDGHGGFEITEYNIRNINWVREAAISYEINSPTYISDDNY